MKQKITKKNLTHWLSVIVIGIVLGFALQFVRAWTEPTAAPPGGNVGAPINTSNVSQAKTGGLGIMGGFVTDRNTFLARLGGNVGIGTVSPTQKMDVAGKIKIGNDAVAPTAGTIRWSGTDFEGFDGTAWKSFTTTGGSPGGPASCTVTGPADGNPLIANYLVNASVDCAFRPGSMPWPGEYPDGYLAYPPSLSSGGTPSSQYHCGEILCDGGTAEYECSSGRWNYQRTTCP